MARPKKDPKTKAENIVSFRLGDELYQELVRYGSEQRDDAGLPLNASMAARKLIKEVLDRLRKTQKR